MEIDRRIDEFAARQYGVIARHQALAVGMTDQMIARRVEKGRWIRLSSGVYAYASAPPKWPRQVAAAVLDHPQAIVAGRSAAHLHGFDGFGTGRPEILSPRPPALAPHWRKRFATAISTRSRQLGSTVS